MEIEEAGELKSFEPIPNEVTLYLSAICYRGSFWCSGPGGLDKSDVIKSIQSYSGVEKARIYSVKLPVLSISYA